jgi:HTH-like domain
MKRPIRAATAPQRSPSASTGAARPRRTGGSNDGHYFELCFRREPNGAARGAIAGLFERRLLEGPVSPARAEWLWAGRWARFAVGERGRALEAFYDELARLLTAIHAVAPLEQVVSFNVRAFGRDAWETWSTTEQRVPTPGPAYPSFGTDPYGSVRVHEALLKEGWEVSRGRVARLMRENGIFGRRTRHFRHTTDSKHTMPVAPNTLDRNFAVDAPNKVWVTDITYISTREGWLYLAAIPRPLLAPRRRVGHERVHRSTAHPRRARDAPVT